MEKVFGRVLELGWLSGVEIDNRRFSWQLSKIYIYIYIAMALFSFHVFLIQYVEYLLSLWMPFERAEPLCTRSHLFNKQPIPLVIIMALPFVMASSNSVGRFGFYFYLFIYFSGTIIGTGNWQTSRVSQLELATICSPVQTKLKTGTGPKTQFIKVLVLNFFKIKNLIFDYK